MNEDTGKAVVDIAYFSDILCVWAYISQIRVDELKGKLGDKVNINYHFITIFGCTKNRIENRWKDQGGYAGFGKHVIECCRPHPHIEINPDIWKKDPPASSAPCHLFLKALQNLEKNGEISHEPFKEYENKTLFEAFCWRVRCAFFRENRNISHLSTLYDLAESMKLPIKPIEEQINNGAAFAALCADNELRETHKLDGSPTYLLNEGRQKLYGNVGYRIIEANIDELLQRPENMASWC